MGRFVHGIFEKMLHTLDESSSTNDKMTKTLLENAYHDPPKPNSVIST